MKSLIIVLIALLIVGSTRSAHAYLDPGAGSMVLQVLLGGLAGLAVVLKLYWHQLLTFMGIRKVVAEGENMEKEMVEEAK